MFAPSLLESPAVGHEHLLREGHWGGKGDERQATGWGSQSPGEGFCEHQGSWREVSYTSIHSPADIPWGLPGTVCPRAGSVALWEPHLPRRTAPAPRSDSQDQENDTLFRGVFPEQLRVCPGAAD